MRIGSGARLIAVATVAVVALGAGLAAGTTAANAAVKWHAVKYTCKVPVIGNDTVSAKAALTAPAKATAGKTVGLSVQLVPTGLPAIAVTDLTVKSTLTESRAQKGSVTVSQYLASANSGSLSLDLTGRLKLTHAGTVYLTAGPVATFSLTSSVTGKTTLSCTASSALPVLGSISVSKAG
jgi:hypothetical protein